MDSIKKISHSPFQINFQSRKTLTKLNSYQELKLIPNINCACCGKKTINPKDFHNAFRLITLPLKSMIKKGVFDCWKSSIPTFNFLTDLSQKFPNKSLDQIEFYSDKTHGKIFETIRESLKIDARGSENDTPKELQDRIKSLYHDILTRARAQLRGSKQVMNRMKVFKKTLEKDPVKLAAFEQLEIYSEKYPKKSLSEILAIDEIYKFHSTKDLLQRAETREKSDYHFNNIEKILKKESPASEDLIQELKDACMHLIESARDPAARTSLMQEVYRDALIVMNCPKLIKKINKELEQVPITYITKDSFLAFAHRHKLNDYQIISSILTPSVASTEHIVAVVEGGRNVLSNISVFCKNCNQVRGSVPYEEFVKYHPEMIKNEQKQINQISSYILKNNVNEEALYYPIEVSKNLAKYTKGAIKPDVSKYCSKRNEQINKHIQAQEEEIRKLKTEREQMHDEKKALIKRLEEIEKTRSEKKKQISDIGNNITKDKIQSDKMQKYIKK